jgi:hypothetical protein
MITCLFWPDEQYTYFKLNFMLCKKRWGSKRFSLRGQYYHIFTYSIQYYQTRIGSVPHNFAGSGSSQCMPIRIDINSKHIPDVYPQSRILIFTHSGCRIPDPGSRISDPGSRILDPGSKSSNKREGWKKNFLITFYVPTNFTKLKIILVLKKKIWANFQRIKELFYPNNCH